MAGPETVYAIHSFDAENDDEISFSIGEPVVVLQRDEGYGDGWWHGRNLQGQIGLFPMNYTEKNPSKPLHEKTFSPHLPTPSTSTSTSTSTKQSTESPALHSTSSISSQPNISTGRAQPSISSHVSLRNTQKMFRNALAHSDLVGVSPEDWSVKQVGVWLEAMQFGNVAEIFKAQEISGDILLELTVESLKELDINTFGKRFKIHSAIHALREERDRLETPPRAHIKDGQQHYSYTKSISMSSPPIPYTDTRKHSPQLSSKIPMSGMNGKDTDSISTLSDNDYRYRGDRQESLLSLHSSSDQRLTRDYLNENTRGWINATTSLSPPPLPVAAGNSNCNGNGSNTTATIPATPTTPTTITTTANNNNTTTTTASSADIRRHPPITLSLSALPSPPPPPSSSPPLPPSLYSHMSLQSFPVQRKPRSDSMGAGFLPTDKPQTVLPVDTRHSVDSVHQRTRFSDGNVAPDIEGWLYKQGDKYKKWNKRWFVLKGANLFYFKSPLDIRMKGVIHLRGYKVMSDETVSTGKYAFKVQHDTERTFYFYTNTEESFKAWFKCLVKTTISRDYKAPVLSSSTIPTISLDMARRMKPRPPSMLLYAKKSTGQQSSMETITSPTSDISISQTPQTQQPHTSALPRSFTTHAYSPTHSDSLSYPTPPQTHPRAKLRPRSQSCSDMSLRTQDSDPPLHHLHHHQKQQQQQQQQQQHHHQQHHHQQQRMPSPELLGLKSLQDYFSVSQQDPDAAPVLHSPNNILATSPTLEPYPLKITRTSIDLSSSLEHFMEGSPSLLRLQEAREWQTSDFVAWINQTLCQHRLNDLMELRTGEILIELLERLSGKEVERLPVTNTGSMSMNMLDRIVAAFKFMGREGVDMGCYHGNAGEGGASASAHSTGESKSFIHGSHGSHGSGSGGGGGSSKSEGFTIKDVFGGNEAKIVEMLSAIRLWADSSHLTSTKKASGGTFGAKGDRDDLRTWGDQDDEVENINSNVLHD
ncbi:hypothetical protein BDF14DRAFT_1994002 [Spinellus fusiger]|nr:hypothetical protein BDF14DRAFT_1994002 [Spinellus fusiger]